MGSRRRRYEPEFKAEAVRLMRQGGRSAVETARNLGVHVNTLHTWARELPVDGSPAKRRVHRNEDTEPIRGLERELHIAREERDVLKKAVEFFASERRRRSRS